MIAMLDRFPAYTLRTLMDEDAELVTILNLTAASEGR